MFWRSLTHRGARPTCPSWLDLACCPDTIKVTRLFGSKGEGVLRVAYSDIQWRLIKDNVMWSLFSSESLIPMKKNNKVTLIKSVNLCDFDSGFCREALILATISIPLDYQQLLGKITAQTTWVTFKDSIFSSMKSFWIYWASNVDSIFCSLSSFCSMKSK